MASIAQEPNGRRRILFTAPDGKRKTIRLGKVPQRAAEMICTKVEALLAAAMSGCPWDGETARWVADLQDDLAGKLAAVGLIPRRASSTLAAFLESYINERTDVKPRALMKWRTTQEYLVARFGAEKPLRDITQGDADGGFIQAGVVIVWRTEFPRPGLSIGAGSALAGVQWLAGVGAVGVHRGFFRLSVALGRSLPVSARDRRAPVGSGRGRGFPLTPRAFLAFRAFPRSLGLFWRAETGVVLILPIFTGWRLGLPV
jgi:hypothetical protein